MPLEVVEQVFENLRDAGLLADSFSLVWHAGEPLVLPVSYYREATDVIRRFESSACHITQCFQTNGTLVTPDFVRFAQEVSARVGVSLDGPAFIHDASRRTRLGRPTHARAVAGFRDLQDAGVDVSSIAVLTDRALDHPDAIFDFFRDLAPSEIGFNIEEIEGINRTSSLASPESALRYYAFMTRLYELWVDAGRTPRIREFAQLREAMLFGSEPFSTLNNPLSIVSVDVEGNFSTFSPELLGVRHAGGRPFVFGHVSTRRLPLLRLNHEFQTVADAIEGGIEACRRSCDYFALCGGGTPSNKYFENGSFESTETLCCRLTKKALADIVLPQVENETARLSKLARPEL